MPLELKMPALSPTMEKGTLARWLVKAGDTVRPGDLLAEIETDKATMEFEAVDEGVIASLVVADGTDDVAVGTVIALIAEHGETFAAPALANTEAAPEIAAVAASEPAAALEGATVAASEPAVLHEVAVVAASKPAAAPSQSGFADGSDIDATPLARRLATINGLSLLGIAGSGACGRVVKADLGLPTRLASASVVVAAPMTATVTTYAPPSDVPMTAVKLSGMRKTIARRLTESKQRIPHFYLTARCNLDALLKQRLALNAGLASRGIKLSVNDMLIKAMALAMIDVPDANVQFGGDELFRFGRVDISIAVAIDGGLVTPVIKDVGALSLSAIASESKALAAMARVGKLTPEACQGGTASISNLGMFGIDEIFPVINPPQALILGVGAGIEQPWKVDGGIALATLMSATASFDHRAIDGAVAAQFMAALRDCIETPLRILC